MKYENINVNSDIYKTLSNEEKLKFVRKKINNIFEESKNEKHPYTITYKGEKKIVSKEKFGLFRDLISREKKLEKIIPIIITNSQITNNNKTVTETISSTYTYGTDDENPYESGFALFSSNGATNVLDDKNNLKTEEEEYLSKKLETDNDFKVDKTIKKKKTLWTNFLAIPIVAKIFRKNKKEKKEKKSFKEKLLSLPIISKIFKKRKKGKYEKEKKSFKEKLLSLPIISKIFKKRKKGKYEKEKKSKNKKTIKERYANSAFGRSMKKRKNRIITFICATTLALATLLNSCSVKLSKKNHDNNSTNKPSSSQIDDNNVSDSFYNENDDHLANDIIIEESTKPSVEENKDDSVLSSDNIEDNNYSLNDIITVEESAKIYTNSYDATYNTNSYVPYFDETSDRIIEAVVYELNGYVYTIYNFDSDALDKIQKLEESGAKMTAVLVNRSDLSYTDGYEGYYNIDSVKTKVKTK